MHFVHFFCHVWTKEHKKKRLTHNSFGDRLYSRDAMLPKLSVPTDAHDKNNLRLTINLLMGQFVWVRFYYITKNSCSCFFEQYLVGCFINLRVH